MKAIRLSSGDYVAGYVCYEKHFAIHRSPGMEHRRGPWHVTHIPTGKQVFEGCRTRYQAVFRLRALLRSTAVHKLPWHDPLAGDWPEGLKAYFRYLREDIESNPEKYRRFFFNNGGK